MCPPRFIIQFNSEKKKGKTINSYYRTIVRDVFNTCRIRLMRSGSKFFHKVYDGGDDLLNKLYFVNDYYFFFSFILSRNVRVPRYNTTFSGNNK